MDDTGTSLPFLPSVSNPTTFNGNNDKYDDDDDDDKTKNAVPQTMADVLLSRNPSFPFSRPKFSCPCCAFVGWGAAPRDDDDDDDNNDDKNFCLPVASQDKNEAEWEAMIPVPDPRDALQQILDSRSEEEKKKGEWLMVDTHAHPHLARERIEEYVESFSSVVDEKATTVPPPLSTVPLSNEPILTLTCSVEPADWTRALEYAAQSPRVLPALGVHPWYLESLDENQYLDQLQALLQQHPAAVVGEVGLCKMARFVRSCPEGKSVALEQQRRVFSAQLKVAATLRRPLSVHCVQQHGVFLQVLQQIKEQATMEQRQEQGQDDDEEEDETLETGETDKTKKKKKKKKKKKEDYVNVLHAFPPAIAMHSFGGTAHQARELLVFEESLYPPPIKKKKRDRRRTTQQQQEEDFEQQEEASPPTSNRPPLFYFGFSHAINVLMCSSEKSLRRGREAIRAIPPERLLSESDVVAAEDVLLGTAGAIGHLATALEQDISQVARWTATNGLRFLSAGEGQQPPQAPPEKKSPAAAGVQDKV